MFKRSFATYVCTFVAFQGGEGVEEVEGGEDRGAGRDGINGGGRVERVGRICQSLLSLLWAGQGFASTIYNVLREFQDVFVQIDQCICPIYKTYLSKLLNVFV